MSCKMVAVERDGAAGVITLNRPEKRGLEFKGRWKENGDPVR